MTQKTKNILLIGGFLVSLFICYKWAISNTLEQYNQYQELKKEQALFKNIPKQLSVLKSKETYYDSLLTTYKLKGSSVQNNLLKFINDYATKNQVQVVHFAEPHIIEKNDLVVKTYDINLQGGYNNLNELIYLLEQETKFGEVISLHFEKKKNFRTNKNYLQARILLKSFG